MALNVSTGTPGDASPAAGAHPANHKFYDRKFLEALQPEELYHLWGDMVSIPANGSNTIVKNYVAELGDLDGSPLTEGVTPTEQTFTNTKIEKSVDQYGGYARTTDRLVEEGLDGVTLEFTKRLAQQGSRTMNKVRRNGLLGGTSERFQGGVADADSITADLLTASTTVADLNFILETFRLAKVKPLTSLAGGSANDGTTPIPAAYPVIVPVQAIDLIRADLGTAFNEVEEYADAAPPIHAQEFGRYRSFRFIYDTEVNVSANAAGTPQDIAQCLIFGQGVQDKPYVTVDLAGGNMKTITKPLGSSGSVDPLDQRASMGWKAKQATFIVQDPYMFRWEVSIGDN